MAKRSPRTAPDKTPDKVSEVNSIVDEELDRDEELCEKEEIHDALLKLFKDVEKGFESQSDRSDDNADYWDAYNCKLGDRQFYNGNSEIFVPIVYNAINARKTRFVNQIFPQSGRYIEVTSANNDQPYGEIALLESYVRQCKLRTQIMPALVRNGDVEGQYTVALSWVKTTRHVVRKVKENPKVEGFDLPEGEEDVQTIEAETIVSGKPHWEVIADSDFCVLPATADSLEDALEQGGSVTIIRRWSKAKLEQMKEDGEILEEEADHLIDSMQKDSHRRVDKAKDAVDAAGIRSDGRGKFAQVYETWTMLTIDDEKLLCRTYYGGEQKILSCKRNPYWSDRLPIFSCPVEKVQGSFKGQSKVSQVAMLQYQANDAVNEAMDSAAYALMPIVMTDPEKNPRIGSMILSLAAVWETSPNDTKFVNFPPLWKDGMEIVGLVRTEIFQTLSVNPSQITQAGGSKKKPSQAEVSNEQQVDILTTADAVTLLEDEILSPAVQFMLEMDHQFRDEEMLVRKYGEMGLRAGMETVPPINLDNAYQFRWFGVEAARNAQQMQQQIALINVLRGIDPKMYEGYKIDLGPAMAQAVENTFGPRLAPVTFKSLRDDISVDPEIENKLLLEGLVVPVHPTDDVKKHIEAHLKALPADAHGTVKVHLQAHMKALEAQQQGQEPKGQPGMPGGAGPPPQGKGAPSPGGGGPRMGAQPQVPRGGQAPPGAIHQDQMQDPMRAPRQ